MIVAALLVLSAQGTSTPLLITTSSLVDARAQTPVANALPLIPKPKSWSPSGSFVAVAPRLSGAGALTNVFRGRIAQRFAGFDQTGIVPIVSIGGSLPPAGYELAIAPKRISIKASGKAGLAMGVQRLANMVEARNGRLVVPCGRMRDWPSSSWRGAHLFVGPHALGFHKQLWSRVLLPLGFNAAVIECQRTEWKAVPRLRGGINMPSGDLANLFAWYRSQGVDARPLVQSFGHMEWLFNTGTYKDLALNPAKPYALDPRKPRTRTFLRQLWREVVDVTKARAVHFGLDEVDMRGWSGTAAEMTKLWQLHLPFLGQLAQQNHVSGMIWSDMCLARGEGAGNCRAPDATAALNRRAAIPAGFSVADWHYLPSPDSTRFATSLRIWKRHGLSPVASSWFEPLNIYGFNRAAVAERSGVLQTTWAGHESSELNMAAQVRQFSAMVLAADYAWSGRSERPEHLGYNPLDVFRRMYFPAPSPVRPIGGRCLVWGTSTGSIRISGCAFRTCQPLTVTKRPVHIEARVQPGTLWLLVEMPTTEKDNAPVATVTVNHRDGTKSTMRLLYGQHIRQASDPALTLYSERAGGLCAIPIKVRKAAASITLGGSHSKSLRILGATWIRPLQ